MDDNTDATDSNTMDPGALERPQHEPGTSEPITDADTMDARPTGEPEDTQNEIKLAKQFIKRWNPGGDIRFRSNSPLKKALLTGFHSTAKHIAAKAVSPSSETMRTI